MTNQLLNTYNQLPIQFERGEGVWLYDKDGNRYLDALCGIAVTGLGHNHPKITQTIHSQAAKILHLSNLVEIPQQLELAELLSSVSDMQAKLFFANSGTEAVEGLIKFARLYGHSQNINNPKVIVMKSAFHGRSMAAISAGGSEKIKQGFEPLLPGFIHIEYDNLKQLRALAEDKEIVAVLLEPIQGEGGIRVPSLGYLQAVREICDQNKWLMLLDEIQTGVARTGQLFAYQHEAIIPDGVSLAKGLANGIPIGAFMIREKYAELFKPGSHGSTFGGNPLSCAVAKATLEEIIQNKLADNAHIQGDKLIAQLRKKVSTHPNVKEVRGKGLMIGIELDRPCRNILHLALKKGIIFNITQLNTIRLLPPLIIQEAQVEQIVEVIPQLIEEFIHSTEAVPVK